MSYIIPYNNNLKEKAKYLRKNSSKAEIIVWSGLKGKQILGYQFNRQKMINKYIVDFYCKPLKLAIEIDDKSHDFKYDYDSKRTKNLNNLGIKILRFNNKDVMENTDGILEEIKRYIQTIQPSP